MTILSAILLILVLLIAFLLFLALVIKKEYLISRDLTVDVSCQQVFDYIRHIKNQEKYSVWVMQDPNVKIEYFGTDGTVGFRNTWKGNKQAGKGEQEITSLVDGESMHMEIRFEEPFQNVAQTEMLTKSIAENQTKVTWIMKGSNKFPLNLMNIIIDGLLGKDLSKSLTNLKTILEQNK